MKLWHLYREELKHTFDEYYGFVIRAASPGEARFIASIGAGDEGQETWLDSRLSKCKELKADGQPGVILSDFNAG